MKRNLPHIVKREKSFVDILLEYIHVNYSSDKEAFGFKNWANPNGFSVISPPVQLQSLFLDFCEFVLHAMIRKVAACGTYSQPIVRINIVLIELGVLNKIRQEIIDG